MARIEWVKLRLNNWALYKLRDMGGGLGYATQSVLLAERVDRYRESNLNDTIDGTDAVLTDRAVESLKMPQPQAYAVIQCYYIGKGETSVRATARYMGKAESTVSANLDQADQALRLWFTANQPVRKILNST